MLDVEDRLEKLLNLGDFEMADQLWGSMDVLPSTLFVYADMNAEQSVRIHAWLKSKGFNIADPNYRLALLFGLFRRPDVESVLKAIEEGDVSWPEETHPFGQALRKAAIRHEDPERLPWLLNHLSWSKEGVPDIEDDWYHYAVGYYLSPTMSDAPVLLANCFKAWSKNDVRSHPKVCESGEVLCHLIENARHVRFESGDVYSLWKLLVNLGHNHLAPSLDGSSNQELCAIMRAYRRAEDLKGLHATKTASRLRYRS